MYNRLFEKKRAWVSAALQGVPKFLYRNPRVPYEAA
jgi:hypothetical protein